LFICFFGENRGKWWKKGETVPPCRDEAKGIKGGVSVKSLAQKNKANQIKEPFFDAIS
jgi:hypothetical protein